MGGAGRSCLFSPREKIEMRGRLATATGHRSPPPSRSVTPVTQTSSAGDICVTQPKGRTPASRPLGAGRGEGSYLFSPREKIEMRGTLATTTGHRSPPPSRSVTPVTQTSSAGDICVTQPKGRTPASRPLGAGRGEGSYLFSPREKIEMRGRLATATGHRTPAPQRSPPGEGWGEGGGRWRDLRSPPPRGQSPRLRKGLRRGDSRIAHSRLPRAAPPPPSAPSPSPHPPPTMSPCEISPFGAGQGAYPRFLGEPVNGHGRAQELLRETPARRRTERRLSALLLRRR